MRDNERYLSMIKPGDRFFYRGKVYTRISYDSHFLDRDGVVGILVLDSHGFVKAFGCDVTVVVIP